MRWHRLVGDSVTDWVSGTQGTEPPPRIRFAPLDLQRVYAAGILGRLRLPGEVQPRSGCVRLYAELSWDAVRAYVALTQLPRGVEELDDAGEATTQIAGVPSIGPGGRITSYGAFTDVSVRPVATLEPSGDWRDPAEVQAIVSGLRRDRPAFELFVAYGYVEPSAYEAAEWADASYVLRLDGTGYRRWRDSVEIPVAAGLPID